MGSADQQKLTVRNKRYCALGEAGSGKTWLAQQLQKDKHRRVITLSLVVSWQGKA
ncbi:hypothetical protein AB0U39_19280, partial [Escherichia coli]